MAQSRASLRSRARWRCCASWGGAAQEREGCARQCTPRFKRGSPERAWKSRMMCRIASPVRSSMSAEDTSSTTATCSFTIRKKSTAPGVHSRPSSACLGALLMSAWTAARALGEEWHRCMLGRGPQVAPEPTSRMLTNHACSVARMRSMYLSMRRVVPREPPCGKRATSSSRPRSPSVSWYALIQPMTCAPGRVAPRPARPAKGSPTGAP